MSRVRYREGSRFFAYEDEERAHEGEESIAAGLDGDELWTDPDFQPGPRSIFRVPDTASMRSHGLVRWRRFLIEDLASALSAPIAQGDLGNSYLVNALSLIGRSKSLLQQIVLSLANAAKGIYTFRLSLEGSWVYVHVDSYLPCRTHGELVFARSLYGNPLCSFIEKACAKLFGCYEALTHGTIDQALHLFSPSMAVEWLRFESELAEEEACDEVWSRIEEGLAYEGGKVGCLRTLPDPYSESVQDRRGIELDQVYEVLAVFVAEAAATLEYDAITVGLVCVRAVQSPEVGMGMFEGRWSAGHELWRQFPFIHATVRAKTDAIIDNLLPGGSSKKPETHGVFWMQIEDFVESFNRLVIDHDPALLPHYRHTRFPIHLTPMVHAEPQSDQPIHQSCTEYLSSGKSPSFPIHVVEKSFLSVHIFQKDNRLRDGIATYPSDSYFWSNIRAPSTREAVLEQSLCYSNAIGAAVLRLEERDGAWVGESTAQVLPMLGASCNTKGFVLPPGFYAIIPLAVGSSSDSIGLSLSVCLNPLCIEFLNSVNIIQNMPVLAVKTTVLKKYEKWEWHEDSTILSVGGLYAEIAEMYDGLQLKKNNDISVV